MHGPAHLSPEQLDHEIDLISRALFSYRGMASNMRNAHLDFPDFTPTPTGADLLFTHDAAARSADDQRDREAIDREIVKFRTYERSLDQNDGLE